jgi:4-diphosphocytidyl-2-C-methyl-D-erythritol kinase
MEDISMLMVKAYAKINVGLNILSKDANDSYHYLDMVNLPLELHDRIEIEIMPNGYDTIVTCDEPSLPVDESNLAYKAEKAMREEFGYTTSLRIHIHKIIPIGAGLAGGSADAAAVIKGINHLLKLHASEEKLLEIGQKIGSDIPFCILDKGAHVTSKGENLELIKVKGRCQVLIVLPKGRLSTKAVYEKYDEINSSSNANIEELIKAFEVNDIEKVIANEGNMLEEAAIALCPGIKEVKDLLKEEVGNALLTGSGSAVFALSRDHHKMWKIYQKFINKGYKAFLTETK